MSEAPDPFNPPGVEWRHVEPQLATVRLLGLAVRGFFVLIACVVFCLAWRGPWSILISAIALGLLVWWAVLIPRRVRAMMYAIRDRDLFQRKGIMFRKLAVVPYVRIQYVDIHVGPIERAFGLTTLTVSTAAPTLAASLQGITPETAAELREILTNRENLTGERDEATDLTSRQVRTWGVVDPDFVRTTTSGGQAAKQDAPMIDSPEPAPPVLNGNNQ